jgi:hypothetical protein
VVTVDVVTAHEFWRTYSTNPVLRARIEGECDRRIRDWVRSAIPTPAPASTAVLPARRAVRIQPAVALRVVD